MIVVLRKNVMNRPMKYNRLIQNFLSQRSNSNSGQVAVALVAGLAAGAIISILFAPSKGSTMRNNIADKAKNLSNDVRDGYLAYKDRLFGHDAAVEEDVTPEVPHFTHTVTKKRKSDIKQLITEAHQDGEQTAHS
jgi:gas vesicle protein